MVFGNFTIWSFHFLLIVQTATSLQLQLPYLAVQSYDAEAFLNAYTKVFMTVRGMQANETSEITLSLVISSRLIWALLVTGLP